MKRMSRQNRAKRWRIWLPCVLILCLLLASAPPVLASVENVPERVSLTVAADEAELNGTTVRLYKVAEFSSDGQYQLGEAYAKYLGGRDFDGSDSGKLEGGAQTLEAYVRADERKADSEAVIQNGRAEFNEVPTGLYLILCDVPSGSAYTVGALLQSLPYDFRDGGYVGDVMLHVKAVSKPGPEKISYKVQKLWQGDAKSDRPAEIFVTILKDGAVYETVRLSADNNWSYSWEAESGVFLVKEDSVPDGYTVQASSDGTTFQITNIRQHESETPSQTETPGSTQVTSGETQAPTPGETQTPGAEQKTQVTTGGEGGTVSTGDHSRIFGWLFLMCVSGLALVTIGWRMARR